MGFIRGKAEASKVSSSGLQLLKAAFAQTALFGSDDTPLYLGMISRGNFSI